jgi:hypothetical protein
MYKLMQTRYVLIERGEGFKNTYTTLRVAEHALAAGTIESYRAVTKAQIKSLGCREYKEEHYFRHLQEEEFYAAHHERCCKATIVSGGIGSSEMLAEVEGLDRLHSIYACNIEGRRTWYPETACVYYKEGETVDVVLKVFPGGVLFVCGVTPGYFDSVRWESIKDQSLAFRCDVAGNSVTGLFKQYKNRP